MLGNYWRLELREMRMSRLLDSKPSFLEEC